MKKVRIYSKKRRRSGVPGTAAMKKVVGETGITPEGGLCPPGRWNKLCLRESGDQYRTIFENTGTAMIIVRDDMVIVLANSEFEKLSRYTREEIEGKKVWTEFIQNDMGRVVASPDQEGEREPEKREFRFQDKEGKTKDVLITIAAIPGTGYHVISLLDITARKLLEAELVQAQKLEAVGRLAGGLAHDLNNQLAVIRGYVDLYLGRLKRSDPVYQAMVHISQAVDRSANLARQLMLFSHKQPSLKAPLNINGIILELREMLEHIMGEGIVLELDLEEEIWLVNADANNIDQVLINLVLNARDAMPQGGAIRVTTRNVTTSRRPSGRQGNFVCLKVSDTGKGMDDYIISHIFEPFFTTKETWGGGGLGLSVVYGIIHAHEGWIEVKSQVGRGSSFQVYLPALL